MVMRVLLALLGVWDTRQTGLLPLQPSSALLPLPVAHVSMK
jgi:hypothetical protein